LIAYQNVVVAAFVAVAAAAAAAVVVVVVVVVAAAAVVVAVNIHLSKFIVLITKQRMMYVIPVFVRLSLNSHVASELDEDVE